MDVTFGRGRHLRWLGVLGAAGIVLLPMLWDSLSTLTRGLILAAYGVAVLGIGLLPELRIRELLKHGTQAQGTVVDAEKGTAHMHTGIPPITHRPVVEFTPTDGRTVTFTSGVGFGHRPSIGGAVPVRYRGEDPERAEIDRAHIWMVPAAIWLVVGVGLLVAAAVVYTGEPQVAPTAEQPQVAPTVLDSPGDSVTEEPGSIEPPPAKVATGRIGDTLTVTDRTGKAQLQVTVTRLKFFRGDQVVQPQHGWHMGVHVEAQALASGQNLYIAALVDGHMYTDYWGDTWAGFDPLLDPDELQWLSWSERVAGWLVVDVPGRHGQLVLHNELNHKVAVWTY